MNKNKTLAEKLKNKFPSYVDIAKKFDTNPNYVGDIARGLRNPIRGKGLKIKKELEQLVKQ